MFTKPFNLENHFETPVSVCEYMVSLLVRDSYKSILKPTIGDKNLFNAGVTKGKMISADDLTVTGTRCEAILMNPPFSPMANGYGLLYSCMEISDEIVALMPWLTIINSDNRTKKLMEFGLKSITHLPRSVFRGSRVQCCVLHLLKGCGEINGRNNFINWYGC